MNSQVLYYTKYATLDMTKADWMQLRKEKGIPKCAIGRKVEFTDNVTGDPVVLKITYQTETTEMVYLNAERVP